MLHNGDWGSSWSQFIILIITRQMRKRKPSLMFNNAFRSAQLDVSTCTWADTATFWIHQTHLLIYCTVGVWHSTVIFQPGFCSLSGFVKIPELLLVLRFFDFVFFTVILLICKANEVVKRLPFHTSLPCLNITHHFGHYTIKIQDQLSYTTFNYIWIGEHY